MIIYENIDNYIAEAMKSHNEVRLSTFRLIKAKFIEYRTSKGAKPIDDNIEIQVLRKMVSERDDSINLYKQAGRTELAEKEAAERDIIKEFLPKEITKEEIEKAYITICASGLEQVKKNMGLFIKKIKEIYPTADGKLVSGVVLEKLN